jgi:hypothetical protein
LITRLDANAVKRAFESGIDRIGYLDYFAYSIQNVPAHIPHERGALWFATIKHILMPRILFPNKEAVDDNERTAKYALADVRYNKGTSISIGYIGESYIDFGRYGMFVPILLLGIMYGLIYRWFILNAPNALFGTAFGTSLLLIPASPLETSNIKIMGTIVAGFIVFAVIARLAGSAAWKWMCGRSK